MALPPKDGPLPSDQARMASEPLTREDLRAYFRESALAARDVKVGVEFEKIGVYAPTAGAIPYEGPSGIEETIRLLTLDYGWKPEYAGGSVYLHKEQFGTISLEPGGQLELSTPALSDAADAWRLESGHVAELRDIGKRLGHVWTSLAVHPVAKLDHIPWIPKQRYTLMREYFTHQGTLGHAMMKSTASLQVSIDYIGEEDAAEKMSLAMRLAPVLVAMFANSCITEGKPNGWKSGRSQIWQNTDSDRCGLVRQVFQRGFRFNDWVEYALDVPMLFIEREGRLIGGIGMTFRNFLKEGFGPYRPVLADWELHLSTLFPETRLKQWIEVRSIDRPPAALAAAVPIFLKALFYDGDAKRFMSRVLADMSYEEASAGLADAAKIALAGKMGRTPLLELAIEAVRIADAAVKQNAIFSANEKSAFEPLKDWILNRKECPADKTLRDYAAHRDIMKIVKDNAL